MLQRTGKVKGKWERGQTMTVLSLEACLWHLGKKYTMNKMSQADPGPQSPTSCQSQQESTGKPNWGWRFPVRHVSNTTASKTPSQHHVAMEEAKTLSSGCLATSADVVVPGKIIVNSFNSEKPWNLPKCKRNKNWSSQLHNWETMRGLTVFAFKFLPKSLGIAAC